MRISRTSSLPAPSQVLVRRCKDSEDGRHWGCITGVNDRAYSRPTPFSTGNFDFSAFNATPTDTQESLLGQFGPFTSTPVDGHGSVLGRRRRTSIECDIEEWSRPSKVALTEFATTVAGEYGVPEEKLADFIESSTLPTQKLLIVILAEIVAGRDESSEDIMKTYLSSPGFKRHIRLNPGKYQVPLPVRPLLSTSRQFFTAISNESTTARSEMKRKLSDGLQKKQDISVLGKALAWNNTQEMTDECWGRFAWLQLFLHEYREEKKDERLFWDAVDAQLTERRETDSQYLVEERAAMASFIYEASLREHIKRYPIKKGGRKKAGKQIPAWQKAISRTVEEMDQYSAEELAGGGNGNEGNGGEGEDGENGDGDGHPGGNGEDDTQCLTVLNEKWRDKFTVYGMMGTIIRNGSGHENNMGNPAWTPRWRPSVDLMPARFCWNHV
ncbi:hypothetical protein C8J57DRAFT_1585747 [Mycena rebaudengoi]|nr:hypothetical protein C8J57DRAFT_1585747 [Mycena rebaudengoi]